MTQGPHRNVPVQGEDVRVSRPSCHGRDGVARWGRCRAVMAATSLMLVFVFATHARDRATQAAELYAAERYVEALPAYDELARESPGSAMAHLGVAAAAGELRQYGAAIEAYRRAIALLPEDRALMGKLANAYRANKQLDEAERWYRRAISANIGEPSARWHVGLAHVALARARLDEAVDYSERAIALDPSASAAYHHLGIALLRLNRLEPAGGAFAAAIARDAELAASHFALGQVATRRGDHAGAADAYRRAIALRPDEPNAHYALAQAAARTGDAEEARAALQRYRTAKAGQYREEALDFLRAEQWNAAIGRLRSALDLHPEYIEAAHDRAYCLLRAGELASARRAYVGILRQDVAYPQAEFYLAVTEHRLGDHTSAERRLLGVLERAPDFADGYRQLAVAREAMGDLAGAEEAFDAGIAQNDAWAPGYRWRGLVRYASGDAPGAESDLRRAIELSPEAPFAHESLARLLAVEGRDLPEALRLATHAAETVATPTHLATLALAHHLLGQRDLAEQALAEALLIAPDDAHVNAVRQRLLRSPEE